MKTSEILIQVLLAIFICFGGMFAAAGVLFAYPVEEIDPPANEQTVDAGLSCTAPAFALVLNDSPDIENSIVVCAFPIEKLGVGDTFSEEHGG